MQLFNDCLHFTNIQFPTSSHKEEILNQSIFRNFLTELDFKSNKPYFTVSHQNILQIKFAIIRDICKFFNQLPSSL